MFCQTVSIWLRRARRADEQYFLYFGLLLSNNKSACYWPFPLFSDKKRENWEVLKSLRSYLKKYMEAEDSLIDYIQVFPFLFSVIVLARGPGFAKFRPSLQSSRILSVASVSLTSRQHPEISEISGKWWVRIAQSVARREKIGLTFEIISRHKVSEQLLEILWSLFIL